MRITLAALFVLGCSPVSAPSDAPPPDANIEPCACPASCLDGVPNCDDLCPQCFTISTCSDGTPLSCSGGAGRSSITCGGTPTADTANCWRER